MFNISVNLKTLGDFIISNKMLIIFVQDHNYDAFYTFLNDNDFVIYTSFTFGRKTVFHIYKRNCLLNC